MKPNYAVAATHIAMVCHEANRALQVSLNDPAIPVAPAWADCGAEMQASALNGVIARLSDPSLTPEQMHDNWCRFKREHGWTWGPVKDDIARTHPCLTDYADLSERDKAKDRLFSAIVGALA